MVTLGEPLVALRAQTPGPVHESPAFTRHIAGAESNVAIGLARLGHSVAFIGRAGEDGLGAAVRARLAQEGIDIRHLVRDPAPTGLLIRESRRFGSAQLLYYRAGCAGSKLAPADVEAARTAIASARGTFVEASDTCSGTAEELHLLNERPMPLRRLQLWPRVRGSQSRSSGRRGVGRERGRARPRPGLHVAGVLDPVGAGDAFAAGFISSRLEGLELCAALERANLCGAFVVAAKGDIEGMPTRRELEASTGGAPDTVR